MTEFLRILETTGPRPQRGPQKGADMTYQIIKGERSVIDLGGIGYPGLLADIPEPPKRLFVAGDPAVLSLPSLAISGSRRATPYGRNTASRFATLAAKAGLSIVTGGARGVDSVATRAAHDAGAKVAVVLAGGIDKPYPQENIGLFQSVVETGGAVVSEQEWDFDPVPYLFRKRNRVITGLSRALLVVEAGLPSGSFAAADYAREAGRAVWAIPGAITCDNAAGVNRLIYHGATPIISDDAFAEQVGAVFGSAPRE